VDREVIDPAFEILENLAVHEQLLGGRILDREFAVADQSPKEPSVSIPQPDQIAIP
jgi:hypothetical protein